MPCVLCPALAGLQGDGGHGTHVAGVIAAVRKDLAGTSGVAPHVRLMLLKVRAGFDVWRLLVMCLARQAPLGR